MPATPPLTPDPARKGAPVGFTLAEVLLSLFIVTVLAAMVIPVVFGRIVDANIRRKATTLSMVAQAIMTYHDHVGMWPSTLVQLSVKPVAGTEVNICGGAMATKDVSRWYGPYLATTIPATGLTLDEDVVLATLVRQSATNLQIQMQYPDADTRTSIQTMLDTDTDSATGVIRWTGSNPTSTLQYNLPIVGC